MFRAFIPWFVFLGGLGIELGIDYLIRMRDGDIRTGGLPETLFFALQLMLATVALLMAWQATRSLEAAWKRLTVVSLQAGIGFVLYAIIGLMYVVGNGIDSL